MNTSIRLTTAGLALLVSTFAGRAETSGARPLAPMVQTISVTLTRIAALPVTAPATDTELKALAKGCHAALTALAKRLGDQAVPEDYVSDLTRAHGILTAMAAKPNLAADDLARLKAVSDDIHAKRRWADKHHDAPTGPVTLEVATAKGKASVGSYDVWSRSALDEQTEPVQPATVSDEPRRISLRPGNYVLWLRSRGATPADGARREFAADGAPMRVELVAP